MTDDAEEQGWATAKTLAEALPYIQIYDRETVVIKYGGHAMGEESVAKLFAAEAASDVTRRAVQLFGGAGYTTDLSFFKKVFRERTGITLSTIHGVKGAEFDVVIAFGLLQGMVPHFSDSGGDCLQPVCTGH